MDTFENNKQIHFRPTPQTHLQTSNIRAEEWCKFATTALSLAFITHLVIENVWFHFDTLVNVTMLELDEPSTDGCYVTLLVAERNAASSFRILQFGICVDACVTHAAIKPVHNHGQFDCNK